MLANVFGTRSLIDEPTYEARDAYHSRRCIFSIWLFYVAGWLFLIISTSVGLRKWVPENLFPRYFFGMILDSNRVVLLGITLFVSCWIATGILIFVHRIRNDNSAIGPKIVRVLVVAVSVAALIWGSYVRLMHSLSDNYHLLEPASPNGCEIIRADSWTAMSGNLYIRPATSNILIRTSAGWWSETTNRNPFDMGYSVTWDAELATIIAADYIWEIDCK